MQCLLWESFVSCIRTALCHCFEYQVLSCFSTFPVFWMMLCFCGNYCLNAMWEYCAVKMLGWLCEHRVVWFKSLFDVRVYCAVGVKSWLIMWVLCFVCVKALLAVWKLCCLYEGFVNCLSTVLCFVYVKSLFAVWVRYCVLFAWRIFCSSVRTLLFVWRFFSVVWVLCFVCVKALLVVWVLCSLWKVPPPSFPSRLKWSKKT